MFKMFFSCIFAREKTSGGFGNNGKIPWNEPLDLAFFKKITTSNFYNKENILICGRKTYETIQHIKNRKIIVVSSTLNSDRVAVSKTLDGALSMCSSFKQSKIFVIGGARL
jgi:dihydrofolate reductase